MYLQFTMFKRAILKNCKSQTYCSCVTFIFLDGVLNIKKYSSNRMHTVFAILFLSYTMQLVIPKVCTKFKSQASVVLENI